MRQYWNKKWCQMCYSSWSLHFKSTLLLPARFDPMPSSLLVWVSWLSFTNLTIWVQTLAPPSLCLWLPKLDFFKTQKLELLQHSLAWLVLRLSTLTCYKALLCSSCKTCLLFSLNPGIFSHLNPKLRTIYMNDTVAQLVEDHWHGQMRNAFEMKASCWITQMAPLILAT